MCRIMEEIESPDGKRTSLRRLTPTHMFTYISTHIKIYEIVAADDRVNFKLISSAFQSENAHRLIAFVGNFLIFRHDRPRYYFVEYNNVASKPLLEPNMRHVFIGAVSLNCAKVRRI